VATVNEIACFCCVQISIMQKERQLHAIIYHLNLITTGAAKKTNLMSDMKHNIS